jgi:hypothetical protein
VPAVGGDVVEGDHGLPAPVGEPDRQDAGRRPDQAEVRRVQDGEPPAYVAIR